MRIVVGNEGESILSGMRLYQSVFFSVLHFLSKEQITRKGALKQIRVPEFSCGVNKGVHGQCVHNHIVKYRDQYCEAHS